MGTVQELGSAPGEWCPQRWKSEHPVTRYVLGPQVTSLGLNVLFCEMGNGSSAYSEGEKASLIEAFTVSWVRRQRLRTNSSDILVIISLFSTRLSLVFQIFKAHLKTRLGWESGEAGSAKGAARQEPPCV